MQKHSVSLNGHRTSISLEPIFWQQLHRLATRHGLPLQTLIEQIDTTRHANLSSALRVYVVEALLAGETEAQGQKHFSVANAQRGLPVSKK